MRRYLHRILICAAFVVASIAVVTWAYFEYDNGRGGFRLGVDLAGGTILVYEVDESKMPQEFKADELAAALKRRIDPNDLYNITIRPVGGTPPRVEIILPTGGQHQARAEQRNWERLLAAVTAKYPVEGQEAPYASLESARGDDIQLGDLVKQLHPATDPQEITDFIGSHSGQSKDHRTLTSSEVESIKTLIEKQGRLEFRILANQLDDGAAIEAARKWIADPANRGELARLDLLAREPPQPRNADGSLYFQTTDLPGQPAYTYSWVEAGKSELHTLGLNSETLGLPANKAMADLVQKAVGDGTTFTLSPRSPLFYARRITDWSRRRVKDREQHKTLEFFILVRDPAKGMEITGDYLVSAHEGQGGKGGAGASIDFGFNSEGGNLFYEVTSLNKPTGNNEQNSFKRQLAILFDGQVVSAPQLNQAIHANGQITGDFTQQDVQDMVRIMRAGALPATLKKDPVSQNSMGATLGQDTIYKGTLAVGGAFLAVLIFMAIYYRFAGGVACVALLANLLMTVAFMVVVKAAFTLPGLAGLVLMLGMAVDANVLIYERLREERERGATLAVAIRNGYDRAFPTIIDTHLSSIFTAIVLYAVGNDQLKGFGISLTVGLIISLFTSLYMTRTLFDVALAEGWLKTMSFSHVKIPVFGRVFDLHDPRVDFMAIRNYWFAATTILTILGAGLFVYRVLDPRNPALNIDFVGGTAYTAELAKPMTLDELHERLNNEDKLPGLSIDQVYLSSDTGLPAGTSRLFTVRTSSQNMEQVMDFVNDKLQTELKLIRLAGFRPSDPTLAAFTFPAKDKEGKETPGFAAPDAVDKAVRAELAGLNLKNAVEVLKSGEEEKGKFSRLQVRLTPGLPWDEYQKVFASVEKKLGQPARLEPAAVTEATLTFAETDEDGTPREGFAAPAQIQSVMRREFEARGLSSTGFELGKLGKERDDHYHELQVKLSSAMPWPEFKEILAKVGQDLDKTPQPLRLEHFDAQLASSTRDRAFYAILLSWAAILLYLWFRFGSWTFGAATVLCLIHDLFFTLGVIVACHYVAGTWFGWSLQIQDFKFDLQSVAALLTLVGYSVNDTIVVFDRIREVRGKNPALTAEMINTSVNQTLSRTLLASMTVWLVVVVLFFFGGEGVHLFAFVMVVGVIVGTYSSIYIASPLLLIFGEGHTPADSRARLGQAAGAGR